MAHSKSAKKRIKQNEKRASRNRGYKRRMKTQVKLTVSATPEDKKSTLSKAYSAIDKAAKKRVIHKNTAARKKSRLAGKVLSS